MENKIVWKFKWMGLTLEFLLIGFLGISLGCSALKEKKKTKEAVTKEVFEAIQTEDIQSINRLVQQKADFNVYDPEGYTPLMRAVQSRNSNFAEKLIKAGAKIYQPHGNKKGFHALEMINTTERDMIRIFKEASQKYENLLETHLLQGDYKAAFTLTKKHYLPIDLKVGDSHMTPLQFMAHRHSKENKGREEGELTQSDIGSDMDTQSNINNMHTQSHLYAQSEALNQYVELIFLGIAPYTQSYANVSTNAYASYTRDSTSEGQVNNPNIRHALAREDYLKNHVKSFQVLSTMVNNPTLFYKLVPLYIDYGKAIPSMMNISNKDKDSITWMNVKLQIINGLDQVIPLDHSHMEIYMDTIRSQDFFQRRQWETLAREVLKSKSNPQKKKQFGQRLFHLFFSKVKQGIDNLDLISRVFDLWQTPVTVVPKLNANAPNLNANIPKLNLDESLLQLLKAIEGKNYDIKKIKNVMGHLYHFCAKSEDRSEESIKFILRSSFRQAQKKKLMEAIVRVSSQILPKDIFAYAIEVGGAPLLSLMVATKTKAKYDPGEQTSAVLAAVVHSPSEEEAWALLTFLREKQVPFNTPFGVQAFKNTLERLWRGEWKQAGPAPLFLSSHPSPLESMETIEILSLLSHHFHFVRSKKIDLDVVHDIVEYMEWTGRKLPTHRYTLPMANPSEASQAAHGSFSEFSAFGLKAIEVSFVWDYITAVYSLHEASSNPPSSSSSHPPPSPSIQSKPNKSQPLSESVEKTDWGSLLSGLSKIMNLFPGEHTSMAFAGRGARLKPKQFVLHNMLPLSLILSIGDKRKIQEILSLKNVEPYRISIDHKVAPFSWAHFLGGTVYNHYSSKPKFWEEVSKVLLSERLKMEKASYREKNMTLQLPQGRDAVDFIKVMTHSGAFQKYGGLSEILGRQKISLKKEDRLCLLKKRDVDQAQDYLVRKKIETFYTRRVVGDELQKVPPRTNLEDIKGGFSKEKDLRHDLPIYDKMDTTLTYDPVWASLGNLEALRPLKNKTCDSQKLSAGELAFVRLFIKNNVSLSSDQGHRVDHRLFPRPLERCSAPPQDGAFYYSQLGVPSLKKNSSRSHTYGQDYESDDGHGGEAIPWAPTLGECYRVGPVDWAEHSVRRFFLESWYHCSLSAEDGALQSYFESKNQIDHADQAQRQEQGLVDHQQTQDGAPRFMGLVARDRPLNQDVRICRWKSL